jgi:hypothetical protein
MCEVPINKIKVMKLTKNFSLSEFTRTSKQVDNIPHDAEIQALKKLCENVLQPIRDEFGSVTVTSGYRSPTLNRLVGGSSSSQHCKGEAVDFKVKDMPACFEWIKENLVFDQLINEFNLSWIHVSFAEKNRQQVLKAVKSGGKTVYLS